MTDLDAGAQLRPQRSRHRRLPPLMWRRLPWWAELAIIVTAYAVYTRSRVAAPAKEKVAFFHASQVWDLEHMLRIDIEVGLNRAVAAWGFFGDMVGYYYGTLHFIVTPAILIWLYFRRPAAYPRLRSTLMIATAAALVTYWAWPLAPPRFAQAGTVDLLASRDILGAADPTGVSGMVNLYAAMPSLHVGWSIWCALALYLTLGGRWRKLVWLYPLATTFVVMATANHYLLDAVGGAAIVGLGYWLTRPYVPATAEAERDDPDDVVTLPDLPARRAS
jgi:hypothetical protein